MHARISSESRCLKFGLNRPESFVRVGPNLITFFLVDEGIRDSNINKQMGNHRPASETPFKWRFAGGPMMAQY